MKFIRQIGLHESYIFKKLQRLVWQFRVGRGSYRR